MLIEFKVTNYRSFRETQTLSMVASTAKEHIKTHSSDAGLGDLGPLLRSAVIYGPNAAGKTNVLRALQFMQGIVINSLAATQVTESPYDPYKLSPKSSRAPSEFEVAFVQNKTRYEYGFAMDAVRVHREWLIEYPMGRGRRLFERFFDKREKRYNWKFSSYLKGNRSVWRDATRQNALFLSTAIQLNSTQLQPVFEWFQKRLVVIVGSTTMNPILTLNVLDQPGGKERVLPFLREADLGIADLEIRREPLPSKGLVLGGSPIIEQPSPGTLPNLVTVMLSHSGDGNSQMSLDLTEESSGTQKLFRTAGAWLNVFENGEVLLFDEIDTSMHPLLVRFLVEKFHSDAANRNSAQLIFSTHDTSLLSQDVFRRDQVWFVEKDKNGASKLFPLSDFSPRKDEVLERWYLRGRYGALPILSHIDA